MKKGISENVDTGKRAEPKKLFRRAAILAAAAAGVACFAKFALFPAIETQEATRHFAPVRAEVVERLLAKGRCAQLASAGRNFELFYARSSLKDQPVNIHAVAAPCRDGSDYPETIRVTALSRTGEVLGKDVIRGRELEWANLRRHAAEQVKAFGFFR